MGTTLVFALVVVSSAAAYGWTRWDVRQRRRKALLAEAAAAALPPPVPASPERRKALMYGALMDHCKRGYRVVSQTDDQAMLVRGHRPNHILHLLLSVVTLGLWLVVWFVVALSVREQHKLLVIDAFGNVHVSR